MNMKYELKKALFYAGIPVYVPLLIGACIIPSLFSKRIKTQEELDKVVKEESEKLGLKGINGVLHKKHKGMVDKNGKTLHVGGFEATRTIVRHEEYHMKKHGNCNFNDKIDYFLRLEPQAILYQYGIRV